MSIDDIWAQQGGWSDSEDEGDEEEEEGEFEKEWSSADKGVAQHYLCLIDCNRTMWEANDGEGGAKNIVSQILGFLSEFVRLNVREQVIRHTGKRNGFSVLLYNTKYRIAKQADPRFVEGEEALKAGEEGKTEEAGGDDEDDEDNFYAADRKTTVHELVPMTKPGVSTVQVMEEAQEGIENLERDYAPPEGGSEPEYCPLQLALAHGIKLLERAKFVSTKATAAKPKVDGVQVWIFSNDPKPANADQMQAQLDDMKEDGKYNLVLWGMPMTGGVPFDYSQFYDSTILQAPLKDKTAEEMQDLWGTLSPELEQYWKPTRPLHKRLPLLLPDWKQVGTDKSNAYLLDWYRVVQTSKKPNLVKVDQKTGRRVQSLTQLVTKENNDILHEKVSGTGSKTKTKPSSRLRHFIELGDDRVNMNPNDKKAVKSGSNTNPDFASMILIGFRSKDAVSGLLSFDVPYVCVAPLRLSNDPEEIKNHTSNYKALSSLHQAMRDEGVVAIGELLTRTTSTSRMVALWPLSLAAERGGDDCVDWPQPSFLAMLMPFADEIRAAKPLDDVIGEEEEGKVDKGAIVETVSTLIRKQTLPEAEIGETFGNPHLTKYWDHVEKLAHRDKAEQADDEDVDFDGTIPSANSLQAFAGEVAELERLLPEARTATRKRKAGGGGSKKTKAPPPVDESGLDWADLLQSGGLEKLKVDQLKAKLKSLGAKVSGKKAELVERLMPLIENEAEAGAGAVSVVKMEDDDY